LVTNANAQFTGYYNLHDGGVDMPSSSLYILPNHEFVLFYFDGYRYGKWKEIDKNNIELNETKNQIDPISVYGKFNKNAVNNSVNVYGLYKSYASISFHKDRIENKEAEPIFNIGANCLDRSYVIKKKKGEYNWVTFTLPSDPDFGRDKTTYPYNVLNYTFPLDKKYTDYMVIPNEDAIRENMNFVITKKNSTYIITGSKGELERKDLTNETLKKIETAKIAIDQQHSTERFGNLLPSISTVKNIISQKSLVKPIFIAKCEEENEKNEAENNLETPLQLTSIDRGNGFYTVLNFKTNENDEEKYKLAKEPSLTRNDILSIKKIISEYDGFEIQIIFTETGKLKFKELTKDNINKPIVIVIDKKIVSAPIIQSEITSGQANIAGRFCEKQIDELLENFKK